MISRYDKINATTGTHLSHAGNIEKHILRIVGSAGFCHVFRDIGEDMIRTEPPLPVHTTAAYRREILRHPLVGDETVYEYVKMWTFSRSDLDNTEIFRVSERTSKATNEKIEGVRIVSRVLERIGGRSVECEFHFYGSAKTSEIFHFLEKNCASLSRTFWAETRMTPTSDRYHIFSTSHSLAYCVPLLAAGVYSLYMIPEFYFCSHIFSIDISHTNSANSVPKAIFMPKCPNCHFGRLKIKLAHLLQ
jgi:hypothetical protein